MQFIVNEKFLQETEALTKEFYKGETIVEEGSSVQFFFYLMEGDLSVFNYSEDGKEFIQHKVQPKNFFGEPAVLLKKPFPGTVRVTSEVATILKIDHKKLIDFLLQNPLQMLEFTKSVAEKSLIKTINLKNLIFLNPEDRLLRNFADYKKSNGKDDQKILINMTRQDLADITGLRIETVIRTIKKMEREEKLVIKRGKIYF